MQFKSIDLSPDPVKVPGKIIHPLLSIIIYTVIFFTGNITAGISLAFTSASPTDIGVCVSRVSNAYLFYFIFVVGSGQHGKESRRLLDKSTMC